MDRIGWMKDAEPKTDCIFHETKFLKFEQLSAAKQA